MRVVGLLLIVHAGFGLTIYGQELGGHVTRFCDGEPACINTSLAVVFGDGNSVYSGPLNVGVEIPVQVVFDVGDAGIIGWSFAVAHDPDLLGVVESSITSDGTVIDENHPDSVTIPPGFQESGVVEGGFYFAAVLSFLSDTELPRGPTPVLHAKYEVRSENAACAIAQLADSFIGRQGQRPTEVALTIEGAARTPAFLRHARFSDEDCGEFCSDGIDNDGDGLVDCDDEDCEQDWWCIRGEYCFDGIDNDQDGDIDCADGDCRFGQRCPIEDCQDGIDNDNDGNIDCDDSGCAESEFCVEDCTNGVDDNGDDLIDCLDPQCFASIECKEICDDGLDNDGDGNVDCDDELDCGNDKACMFVSPRFSRGDADGDGRLTVSDAVLQIRIVLGRVPSRFDCEDALDSNADGKVNISDAVPLLTWVFHGGKRLPDPFLSCGEGPSCVESAPACQ